MSGSILKSMRDFIEWTKILKKILLASDQDVGSKHTTERITSASNSIKESDNERNARISAPALIAIGASADFKTHSTRIAAVGERHLLPFEVKANFRKIDTAEQIAASRIDVAAGGEIGAAEGAKAPHASISVKGKGAILMLADNCLLYRTSISVTGDGSCIFIGSRSVVKAVVFAVVGKGNLVALGRGVTWESGVAVCMPENQFILVGDDCMLSNNVMLRTDDSHGIFDLETKSRLNLPAPVILERHVWLGNGARCNKGARIGTGTVVGGASVVSGTLEPNCVYAGVPARKKREKTIWSRTGNWADIPSELIGNDC